MNKSVQLCLLLLFIISLLGNAFIFVSSMKLGEETHRFEQKTYLLQRENAELEKQMSEVVSLQHSFTYKDKWAFVTTKDPITVGELQFALYKAP